MRSSNAEGEILSVFGGGGGGPRKRGLLTLREKSLAWGGGRFSWRAEETKGRSKGRKKMSLVFEGSEIDGREDRGWKTIFC